MFSQNRTSQWLKNQDSRSLEKLLNQARQSTGKIRTLFNQRKETIEERKREQVAARIQSREQAQRKKIEQKEEITCQMIEYGLWQTHHEVDEQVSSYRTTKKKIYALKSQLRFRQKVLEQASEQPGVYNFTKVVNSRRLPLTVEELVSNVKMLVQQATETATDNNDENELVLKRVRHRFMSEEGETWYHGKVISQVKS
jgi:hypothetical protein